MGTQTRWQSYGRYPYLFAKYALPALALAAVLALLYRLSIVVIPVLFAGFLAFVLHRPADWLVRRGLPRSVAAGLMVLLGLLVVSALLLLIVPTLFFQVSELMARLPAMLDALDQAVAPVLQERFGVSMHLDQAALTRVLQQHAQDLAAPSGWLVKRLFASALTVGLAVLNVVIVIVFTFHLIRSHDAIGRRIRDLIPPRYFAAFQTAGAAVDEALGGFVLGQVTVCLIMACLYAVALSVAGVNGGAVIGILTGLANFVPYVGLATGLSLSLLSVGLDWTGPAQVIMVLAIFGGLPMLDAMVITPGIVGNRTGLNPFLVIVALLVGGELLGFLGLLLALPTAAVLRGLIVVWVDAYRNSRFYRGEDAKDEA